MLEYMENVSQSEAENIRKTIQDLFRQTCILQTKCDPVTLIQKDNPHYQVCARWKIVTDEQISVEIWKLLFCGRRKLEDTRTDSRRFVFSVDAKKEDLEKT